MNIFLSKIQKNPALYLVLACILVRLPFLYCTQQPLDADECVVALMAKHAFEGKAVPLFFYGQSYGFAWVEFSLIRLFYFVFGVNDLAVRLPMLLLFVFGVVFHYKTLANISQKTENTNENEYNWLPFLFALLLAFAPTWAVWSLKARGGYLTAFALFGVLTYIVTNKNKVQKTIFQLLIGVLLVVLFQAQPLFLVGLLPILSFYGYKNTDFSTINHKQRILIVCKIGLGIALAALFFVYSKQGLSDFWQPKVFALDFFHVRTIDIQIKETLTGSFVFLYQNPVFVMILWANLAFYLGIIGLLASIFFFIKKGKVNAAIYFFCIAILLTIAYRLFILDDSPRYLLPLYTYLSFLFFGIMAHLTANYKQYMRISYAILYFMLLLGFVATLTFCDKNLEYTDKKDLYALITHFKTKQTPYLYSTDGTLSWQVLFYSQEQVIMRGFSHNDRYPQYAVTVDSVFATQAAHTAIIDRARDTTTLWSPNISYSPNKTYYIYTAPSSDILEKYRFQVF